MNLNMPWMMICWLYHLQKLLRKHKTKVSTVKKLLTLFQAIARTNQQKIRAEQQFVNMELESISSKGDISMVSIGRFIPYRCSGCYGILNWSRIECRPAEPNFSLLFLPFQVASYFALALHEGIIDLLRTSHSRHRKNGIESKRTAVGQSVGSRDSGALPNIQQ